MGAAAAWTRLDSDPPDDLDFSKMRFDAGPTLQDDRGENALMKAAALGHLECTLPLIRDTPYMNETQWTDKSGQTPLMHAVQAGDDEFLKALAERDDWTHLKGNIRHPSMFFYPRGAYGGESIEGRTVIEYLEAHEMNDAATVLRSQIQAMIEQCTQTIEDAENPEDAAGALENRATFWQELGETKRAEADLRKASESRVTE